VLANLLRDVGMLGALGIQGSEDCDGCHDW
jgi:hypothetical protein